MAVTELEYLRRAEGSREKLYRAAFMTLGSEAAAIDAVDEAVYRGYRKFHTLRKQEYLETWLMRILINVCRDELRRRRRELSVAELPETAQAEFDALPLKEAIRRLPEALRQVVVLRFFSGFTLEETAAILEIPRGTVATWQRRALAILRLELSGEEEQP